MVRLGESLFKLKMDYGRYVAVKVFIISVVMLVTVVYIAPDSFLEKPCSDCEGWYYPVSQNLLDGNGLVVGPNRRPALDRPPGHVLILAGALSIGRKLEISKEVTVYALNIILLSISATLLFLISQKLWGTQGGIITAGAWVTSPFIVWFLNQPFSEVSFFVFLYLAVFLFLNRHADGTVNVRSQFFVGISLGVAVLIRPIGIGLFIPFAIAIFFHAPTRLLVTRKKSIVAMVFGVVLILLPWQAYLANVKGSFHLISAGVHGHRSLVEGFIFGVHNEGYRVGIDLSPGVKAFMQDMETIIVFYDRIPDGREKYGPGGIYDVKSSLNILKIALPRLIENPKVGFDLFWLKLSRSWYGTDSNRYEYYSAVLQLVYLFFIVPALIKACRQENTRILALLALFITCYFWSFAVAFTPLVRYMIPALGVLFTVIPGLWIRSRLKE